jgi:hypothetical protein
LCFHDGFSFIFCWFCCCEWYFNCRTTLKGKWSLCHWVNFYLVEWHPFEVSSKSIFFLISFFLGKIDVVNCWPFHPCGLICEYRKERWRETGGTKGTEGTGGTDLQTLNEWSRKIEVGSWKSEDRSRKTEVLRWKVSRTGEGFGSSVDVWRGYF